MKIRFLKLLIIAVLFCVGCKQKEYEMCPDCPKILTLTPNHGPYGTKVIIEGTKFGTDPTKMTITFNGKPALIDLDTISDTRLVVTIPKGCGTGNVHIKTNRLDGDGPQFQYDITYSVVSYAGGVKGYQIGDIASARFNFPNGITIDKNGDILVADAGNHCIRKIFYQYGNVQTIIGVGGAISNGYESNSVPATSAHFSACFDMVSMTDGSIYIADRDNNCIRKLSTNGNVTLWAGDQASGFADGASTVSRFYYPTGITKDNFGNLYVCDYGNQRIRKIAPNHLITTIAGSSWGYADGPASMAKFNCPSDLCYDSVLNVLYITESKGNRIRKLDLNNMIVSTLAGDGNFEGGHINGPGNIAEFNNPWGITLDSARNILVCDSYNNMLRLISQDGFVSDFAGVGSAGGADGPALYAQFDRPNDLVFLNNGIIMVTEGDGNRVRQILVE